MAQSDGRNKLDRITFEFKGQFYNFKVNPQEFQQVEASRSTVTQTKSGAWIDDFGPALPTIYIKGHTGFADGFGIERWKELRDTLRSYYNNIQPGQTVTDELIFHNLTDEESWVVHIDPNSGFKLYRSVNNPLLYQYEVYMIALRPANEPSSTSSSGVSVGNPLGSSIPKSNKVPNTPSTQTYNYAVPYMMDALQSNSSGQVPNYLGDYVARPTILSNGTVQVVGTAHILANASRPLMAGNTVVNLDPVMTPQVSNLAVQVYTNLNTGSTKYTTQTELDPTSFIYQLINNKNINVTTQMEAVIQMCFLELIAIHHTLMTDPTSLSNNVSQDDLERLIQNIRWITNQLSSIPSYDLTIVEGLRWIERCVQYIARTDSLFTPNALQTISGYTNALGGV